MSEEAFIYEAIRTPRGKGRNGALTEVKPLNLVTGLIDEMRSRHPNIDENMISDVILGCVSPVGDPGGDIAKSIVPVRDQNGLLILEHDEHMRPGTTMESLANLKPAFEALAAMAGFDDVAMQKYHWVEKINHVHTGGNSSGIVDGAALVLVGSEKAGKANGLTPRARIVATATSGADPTIMLVGPTPAALKALDRAGLTVDDIDLWELNEAFASVVLKFQKDLGIPSEKLNVNGGAIAMGHPLGATGAMITGTMVDELERRGAKRALITLCIGGGMGVATIIERV